MKLTNEYLISVADKFKFGVDQPFIWIDDDWSVDLCYSIIEPCQDTNNRLEVWVYYDNKLLVNIDNVEQLEAFYFGINNKKLNDNE